MKKNNVSIFTLVVLLLSLTSGCTTLKSTDDVSKQISADPLEGFNRTMYGFNKTADKVILKPVSQAYNYVLPKPAKKSVGNFFDNLAEPLNIVNNSLQGKGNRALNSTYRFVINSTVGVLGLFDVASYYKIKPAKEDFGQTLAAWGVKPGPYVMLPLLGPTNFRDGIARVGETAVYYPNKIITDSDGAALALTALDVINTRASLLSLDSVLESQPDQYNFIKSTYEANRINSIYDGKPPQKSEDDLDF